MGDSSLMIIPLLQKKKAKLGKVMCLAQDHAAGERQTKGPSVTRSFITRIYQ